MLFTHDTDVALQAAADLVNTAGEPDGLATVTALAEFYERGGYTGHHGRDAAELTAVRALRPVLRTLLTAERDEAVAQVNALLREHDALPQLVRHDGWDWHLHAAPSESPLARRIALETALAMVDVIRAGELSRLSECALEDCDGVVVDLSRNRSRRFCSTSCGNRAASAAYRARQAGVPDEAAT